MSHYHSKKRLNHVSGTSSTSQNPRLNPGSTYSLRGNDGYVESSLSESSQDLLKYAGNTVTSSKDSLKFDCIFAKFISLPNNVFTCLEIFFDYVENSKDPEIDNLPITMVSKESIFGRLRELPRYWIDQYFVRTCFERVPKSYPYFFPYLENESSLNFRKLVDILIERRINPRDILNDISGRAPKSSRHYNKIIYELLRHNPYIYDKYLVDEPDDKIIAILFKTEIQVSSGKISNDTWFSLICDEPAPFVNFQVPRHFDVTFTYTHINSWSF